MVKVIISLCALFIAAFLLYFIICTNNEAELGQGYYYLSKAEAADVGYPDCESIIYKSDARNVFQTVLIKGDVVAISKNDKYILAVQAPLRHCNHNELTRENKSLLKYFIVDKEHDLLFGPYNEMDFLKKKGELAVPNTLVFRRGL